MFTSKVSAAADTTSNTPGIGTSLANLIPLILIIVVFYFFIIRPHHKKLKELKKMIDQVKRGDTVVTSGGIIGEVNKLDEANAQFIIEIAPKVEIKVLKSAISEVLNKEAQKIVVKASEKVKIEKEDKKNKNRLDKTNKG
ncbi:preprotein translocase subunit YajC [Wolbachia endosymbiont of Dipetalonema caudispina]|uniref:preprotein translocase subunit YajC n=1 Tax=Wolbachia endosymbiont of Dipetalonema caudispina TaxID=1812112 RepID=UPI00158886CF|nr:preprotein translocase subunit YajC [Wolbachia endosymbiont of Dipetalonema caudispina]MCV3769609.1 preprotein translocase subunit YajC [Wolbachia pipientis]QKX01300.1 preprotein translocase subunit YajC [Wolbachia endosymbiont of Dipetalonema caudispina]